MKKIIGSIVVIMALSGCGAANNAVKTDTTNKPSGAAIVYDCQGQEVKVDYAHDGETQTAQLFFTGKTHEDIVLPLVTSASGEKYSDGAITFWTHEEKATLSLNANGEGITCTKKDVKNDQSATMNTI